MEGEHGHGPCFFLSSEDCVAEAFWEVDGAYRIIIGSEIKITRNLNSDLTIWSGILSSSFMFLDFFYRRLAFCFSLSSFQWIVMRSIYMSASYI